MFTAGGSLLAMAAAISTHGLSQLLGSTPLGPIGWGQAPGTAAIATAASAVAPRVVGALSRARDASEESRGEPGPLTIAAPVAPHDGADISPNGMRRTHEPTLVNGSVVAPSTVTAAR